MADYVQRGNMYGDRGADGTSTSTGISRPQEGGAHAGDEVRTGTRQGFTEGGRGFNKRFRTLKFERIYLARNFSCGGGLLPRQKSNCPVCRLSVGAEDLPLALRRGTGERLEVSVSGITTEGFAFAVCGRISFR